MTHHHTVVYGLNLKLIVELPKKNNSVILVMQDEFQDVKDNDIPERVVIRNPRKNHMHYISFTTEKPEYRQ